jgi:hypothetical protein
MQSRSVQAAVAAHPGCTVAIANDCRPAVGGDPNADFPSSSEVFFCVDERCPRSIFTESLPGTVSRYGRRSDRASEALSWVTLALGGRAGSRLARKLGLLASRTTLLHGLRRQAP